MRYPDGTQVDIDYDEDLEEDGGIGTEEIVLDWLHHRRDDPTGTTAPQLAFLMEISAKHAMDRLVNLFENELVEVDGGCNAQGRFFLLPRTSLT